MGVPVTDTLRVLDVLNEFIAAREDVCEDMLNDFNDDEYNSPDEWERFAFSEPVRIAQGFCCRHRCDTGGHTHTKWPVKTRENK